MRSRAIWMLGLAVLLAVAAVFLAQNWLVKQTKPDVAAKPNVATVVVARTALDFGAIIRKEHLRIIAWPSKALPKGAFRSIAEVVGDKDHRVALGRIEINEPVLKSKVSGFGGRASLSAIISRQMRAATIRVNDVNGVGGFVLPGDRVDVLLTRDPVGGKRGSSRNLMTDILLQNVKVLALDQNSSENKEKPSVAKSATLEVTPRQAQKLVLAQQVGTLSLALRNVDNVAAVAAQTVKLRDLRVGEINGAAKTAGNTLAVSGKKAAKTPVKKPKSTVSIIRGLQETEVDVTRERTAVARPGLSKPPIARPEGAAPKAGRKDREVRIDGPARSLRSELRPSAVSVVMPRRPAWPKAPLFGRAAMSEPSARPGPTPA